MSPPTPPTSPQADPAPGAPNTPASEPAPGPDAPDAPAWATRALDRLIEHVSAFEAAHRDAADRVDPAFRESARNLLHYAALRQQDVRGLQMVLTGLGLSSLGRLESQVLRSLRAVRRAAGAIAGLAPARPDAHHQALDVERGPERLVQHTQTLLGPAPAGRRVRVMVTLPSEAAHDPGLAHRLIEAGMDCARINCAHDGPEAWSAMIEHVRTAARSIGDRPCRVLMDLCGPKVRTGPIEPGPQVIKCRPRRDELGRVVGAGRLRLVPQGLWPPVLSRDPAVPVPAHWLERLRPGQEIELVDARGKRRALRVAGAAPGGLWAECDQTVYLMSGTELHAGSGSASGAGSCVAGRVPALEQRLSLWRGDRLWLTGHDQIGRPARGVRGSPGHAPAQIACTLNEVLGALRPGHRVWFDDGAIGAVVLSAQAGRAELEITQAPEPGSPPARLGSDKGINVPDTSLPIAGLSVKDKVDLAFIAQHADLVGLSFVRRVEDVEECLALIEASGANAGSRGVHKREHPLGLVLKIETARAFRRMPELLLAAMRSPASGVMIARGDLAVEVGYQRLAEVQEEILWMCEAAHVPVIWATQVLESMAKTGRPSRAEITDAAMAERAECVMLNKGPFVVPAVRVLDDILRRMESHQFKKRAMLRPLSVARRYGSRGQAPR